MIMSSVVIQNSTDTTIPGNDNIQNKKKKTEKIKKKRLFFSKHNHKISNNDNNDVNDDRQHIENHITPVETPSLVNTSSQQPSQTTTTVPAPTSDFSASYRPLDAINENVEYYMLPKSTTSIPIQQQQQQQHQVLTTYDDGQQYFIDSRSLPVYATLRKSHRSHYQEPQPLYYSTDQGGQRIYSLSPQHNDEWKRQFVYGTISPSEQIHYQQPRRIPLSQLPISSSSPSNFQPISPDHRYHHQSHPFSERNETDLVKPTFFIVPKSTEKELTKQLEKEKSEHVTTNSPQLVNNKKMAKEASNKTNKKLDKNKKTNGKISNNVIEIPNKTYRNVEVQTTIPSTINTSPDKVIHQTPPVEIHTINDQLRHVGLTTSPVNSPSPYVHFVTVPQILSDGPPEQSVMQDENIHLIPMMNSPTLYSDYDAQQRSASVRSMPNIAVGQVSPQFYTRTVHPYFVRTDEEVNYNPPVYQRHKAYANVVDNHHLQQQQQQQQQLNNNRTEEARVPSVPVDGVPSANNMRSNTLPQMSQIQQQQQQQQQQVPDSAVNKSNSLRAKQTVTLATTRTHVETPTDESSVASLDFPADMDVPGSWKFRSLDGNVHRVTRGRHRAPLPNSFIDPTGIHSDTEIVRSASFRHMQHQPTLLQNSRIYGSIPAISKTYDSMRNGVQFNMTRMSEKDAQKVASFYQSIGTLVYVGRSIATLYTSDFNSMANLKDWRKLYTGIPVWLFNTGMNPKRGRSIRLIISEIGSSFTLWDTIVNGASDVRLPKERHITLKSLEKGTVLALKFDDMSATEEFHNYFSRLSSDPRNQDLFDVFNPKRRLPIFPLRKKKVKKSAISKPTEFNHITKVDENDRESLYTYSVLVEDH